MKKIKFRIITDENLGFKPQYKHWFMPFWFDLAKHGINRSVADCDAMIRSVIDNKSKSKFTPRVVKEY